MNDNHIVDSIQVKSDKLCILYVLSIFSALCVLPVICFFDREYHIGITLFLLNVLFILRLCIAVFRTITLSPTGIQVRFLRFSTELTWDEVSVSIETYENNIIGARNRTQGAAVFYRKSGLFKKPRSWQPVNYNIFVHPFSFVYVCFPETKNFTGPEFYPLERKILTEAFCAWQVRFEAEVR